MLFFESQNPQDLLREVAEYLRQLAANNARYTGRTQKSKALAQARENALQCAAVDLDHAGILPPDAVARLAASRADNAACNHTGEDCDCDDPNAAAELSATNTAPDAVPPFIDPPAPLTAPPPFTQDILSRPHPEREAAQPVDDAAAQLAIAKALKVLVLTQHIREYLELYDPQAFKQACDALSLKGSMDRLLEQAREFATPEAAFGTYNQHVDDLLGRTSAANAAPVSPADTDAAAEWSIDAAMAEREAATPDPYCPRHGSMGHWGVVNLGPCSCAKS